MLTAPINTMRSTTYRLRRFAALACCAGVVLICTSAHAGNPCVLKTSVVVFTKPKGQGRKIHLSAGASVELLTHNQNWVLLRSGNQEGYGQLASVRHACPSHSNPNGSHSSDPMAELPLEPLPLPALVALPPPAPAGPTHVTADAVPPGEATSPVAELLANDMPVLPSSSTPEPSPATPPAKPTAVDKAYAIPVFAQAPSYGAATVAPPDSGTPGVDAALPQPHRLGPYRTAAWITGGIAVAAGTGLWLYSNAVYPSLSQDIAKYVSSTHQTLSTYQSLNQRSLMFNAAQIGGYVVGGIGLAALATGVVLTVVRDDPPAEASVTALSRPSGEVRVMVAPGGLTVFGQF